jgi:hypothetical protein
MYVSYGLNVALGIAAFIVSFIFFKTDLKIAFAAIIITLVVTFHLSLGWSKYIHTSILFLMIKCSYKN